MERYCCLRNIQDLLFDGKRLYERRFGAPFHGPVIPCGAIVEYHPISAEDLLRLHQFGPKKCIDVTRTTDTFLDVMLEKNIEDNWNVDGAHGVGFTRFTILDEKPPDGYT